MGKSSPKPPTPPNPAAIAAAQGATNVATAQAQARLNRIDEYTPYGSSVYEPSGEPDVGGITPYKRTTTLDPSQQEILDNQNLVTKELNEVAASQVGRVGTALEDPFSYEGIVPSGDTAGAGQAVQRSADIAGADYNYLGQPDSPTSQRITDSANIAASSVNDPFNLSGSIPDSSGISNAALRAETGMESPFNYEGISSAPTTGGAEAAVQTATDAYGTPFDYTGAPAAPSADAAARQQVIDSVYGQYASRLDPKFSSEETAMKTQLANSGISQGSNAYSGRMDDFYRGRNDAYQGAQNAAIQAGGAEQSRLFGLGSAARQNAISEQNYLRALPGQEQGQLLGYQGQLSGLQGAARDRDAQERMTQREVPIKDAERLQNLREAQFSADTAIRNRSVQEQLLQRGLPAEEQARIQKMQGAAYEAQAQDRDRAIQEQLSQRAVPLTEQQQIFNMQQGLFGLDQSARQRAIEEAAYLRNMPLNETSALLSGNQINNPQFGAAPQTGIANTDYAGMVANQYAGQMNTYNQEMAQNRATTGAIGSMAGALGGAAITKFSDRRVKRNISKVGELDNGLPVYSFQYIWGGPQQIGLMAQDVEKVMPSAVVEDSNGIKGVNYSEAVKL